jgi:hypothetical protein
MHNHEDEHVHDDDDDDINGGVTLTLYLQSSPPLTIRLLTMLQSTDMTTESCAFHVSCLRSTCMDLMLNSLPLENSSWSLSGAHTTLYTGCAVGHAHTHTDTGGGRYTSSRTSGARSGSRQRNTQHTHGGQR